jgi:hypothetical protein
MDKNVMVSMQFAVVPVPGGRAAWSKPDPAASLADGAPGGPPRPAAADAPSRVAFNLSVSPAGSAAYVIADTAGGGGEAVVAGGSHSLLFADVDGQRAPFAAGERQGPGGPEAARRLGGVDIDAQRLCVVQVPLRAGAKGLAPGGMGAPPEAPDPADPDPGPAPTTTYPATTYPPGRAPRPLPRPAPVPRPKPKPAAVPGPGKALPPPGVDYHPVRPNRPAMAAELSAAEGPEGGAEGSAGSARPGLVRPGRVAFGHGEPEGPYSPGGGFRGSRAPEPVRVTFVYFVTPRGQVLEPDMERMAEALAGWGD